ncbi:MAG TPA: hypothetical protein VGL71_09360 [Urbifossiella sp.]|jgi:hypothetical protein
MSPHEIHQDLKRQPFEPFRLQISDGTFHDIMHPELCMVGMASVIIGIPPNPNSSLYDHTVKIDCAHIAKQVPLPRTIPPTMNGHATG